LKDAEGTIIGISVVAEEITERKRGEAMLRELNQTLERRVGRKRKSERKSGMSAKTCW
jgi:hypothetical protein